MRVRRVVRVPFVLYVLCAGHRGNVPSNTCRCQIRAIFVLALVHAGPGGSVPATAAVQGWVLQLMAHQGVSATTQPIV
eukprot:scaffold9468_cov19-Tisochrysis_lutea.AAC.1